MGNYRYAGIETYDINNGKEFGVTFFVQGCPHHCPECHNPQTWDFNGGKPLTSKVINNLVCLFKNDNIKRLTISGGEPLANVEVSLSVVSLFKSICPNKKVWIYTGFKYEDICNKEYISNLLSMCDVLVDGQFIKEERDLSLPFRGSKNQRIIDLNKSRELNDTILYNV